MSAKILLVEDEDYIRRLYSHILIKGGYLVDETENGEDAYTKIVAHSYDLVLLDIMIPKIDGLQILEKLQDEGKSELIKKIVLLTNLDEEVTVARGVSYGVRGYFLKSQNPPEKLVSKIAEFIGS